VTRDLSDAKRAMIVAWLNAHIGPPGVATHEEGVALSPSAAAESASLRVAVVTPRLRLSPETVALVRRLVGDPTDGKGTALVNLLG
jgi:hypothetical protein